MHYYIIGGIASLAGGVAVFFLLRKQLKRWAEPELRKTERLLKVANVQLEHALDENSQLRQEKKELAAELAQLKRDNGALHGELAAVKEAGADMKAVMVRMEARQKELEEKNDRFLTRIIHLESASGITPQLPMS